MAVNMLNLLLHYVLFRDLFIDLYMYEHLK